MSSFPTGWINDHAAVAAYIAERRYAGIPCEIGAARPDLQGFWRKTVESGVFAVLLFQSELDVLGEYLPADYQRRGTCVARGTYRAVQTSYWHAISEARIVALAERVAYEPIYGGSRVNVGGGQLSGDGSIGAWAAKWVHDYGVVERGKFGSVDLTQDQEELACRWGTRGVGVPREIISAAAAHKCDAYNVPSGNALADVTAAGYASAICSSHMQSGTRDQNGECGYAGPTAHCEAIVGVYLRSSWDGNLATIYDHTGFVDQQSWGNTPGGPDVLRFWKGDAKLRQGAYGTPMKALRARLATGETWAFRLRDGWRADSLKGSV